MQVDRKSIIAIAFIAIISIVSYVIISNYLEEKRIADQEFREAEKLLKTSSSSAENIIRLTYDESSVTYAELFDKTNQSINDIDKSIIFINASSVENSWKKNSNEYLRALQEVLRSIKTKHQKYLSWQNTANNLIERANDYKYSPYSEYTDRYERRSIEKLKEELDEKREEMDSADTSHYKSMKDLETVWTKASKALGSDTLIERSVLDSALKEASPKNTEE